MNFIFLFTSIILISTFVGTAFALNVDKEYTQEEIDALKNKAVVLQTYEGTLTIELFPEDAPNAVENFLNLVESGYYDGVVFHRIIPGFMIQAGDPDTKNPDYDRSLWGQGGPGYAVAEEFNTIKHLRGIVSMARGEHPDSAGSQFFIVHQSSTFLDGQYTAFGRLVPGTHSTYGLDLIADLETDMRDAPIDVMKATIIEAYVIDPYVTTGFAAPERNSTIIKSEKVGGGITDNYYNEINRASFDLPYRWTMVDNSGDELNIKLEPRYDEHNAQMIADQSGFIPLVMVGSEKRTSWELENNETSSGFFSIQKGDDPEILANYIFVNDNTGKKAHLMVTTQNLETEDGPIEFKILQIHFNNAETNYSVIYVGLTEFFRYEVPAFQQVVNNFEIEIDGKMQPVDFAENPVFKQVLAESKTIPEPESPPPARIGGCLIATAAFGSEMAPQVQLLREIRDNTILQTESGTNFMSGFNQFYYSFSPAIADYERENPVFKEVVKITLTPLLTSLTLLQYADINSEHEMLGYGIGAILLNIGMYFVAPAVLIMKIRSFYKLQ